MKQSLILTVAILAIGISSGLFQQSRMATLREEHRVLAGEAKKLGLTEILDFSSGEPRLTKRQREDREKHASAMAAEVIAFAKESEELEKNGGKEDSELQKRAMDMMTRLMELDAGQLKEVIARLRDSKEISADTRGNIIAFSILTMSEDHPEAAIALYTESSDLMSKNMIGDQVVASALGKWAEINPVAALDWIRKNEQSHPELANDEARVSALAGAALNDPKLAFKLLSDMELDHPASAISAIVMTGHDNHEQRDQVIAALREHLGTIPDETERAEVRAKALEMFARTADDEGFDSLTKWMDTAKFSAEEKEQFAGGLTYFTTKEDTGKWVEWISGNLPSSDVPDPVREIVGEWTQQDYVAAGEWLSTYKDGPAKTAAVEAYAEAVAEYEPQVAAQWAMTLPPGPGRDSTLKSVYSNWPASDPEGAAAFAREHGLE